MMNRPLDHARLLADLDSDDAERRLAALRALSTAGEEARFAAVLLLHRVADESEEARELATAALEDLGPPAPADLPQLVRQLEHRNADAAYWAATLIGRLEGRASGAVEPLAEALTGHKELQVRERAAWALGKIGPAASTATGALQLAAASQSPRLARLAQQALRSVQTVE